MLTNLGDSHRFGQAVRSRLHLGVEWVDKPRPITFEMLFFGIDTQLPLFKQLGVPALARSIERGLWDNSITSLAPYFFTGNEQDLQCSFSYAVRSGQLLAIASLFGLYDLHADNIKIIDYQGELIPLPIDLECFFFAMSSGAESYLIDSKFLKLDRSGLAGQTLKPYRTNYPEKLLDSFLSTCNVVIGDFKKIFTHLESQLKQTPNRIILRNTRDYRQLLLAIKNQKNIDFENIIHHPLLTDQPLLPSEWQQLIAGDIPYYFVDDFYNLETLSYFSSPNKKERITLGNFAPKLKAAVPSRQDFVDPERLAQLIVNTSMQILDKFFDKSQKEACGEFFIARFAGPTMQLETPWFEAENDNTLLSS